eukprot:13463392-Alexandrium_andersonii.AAC.1
MHTGSSRPLRTRKGVRQGDPVAAHLFMLDQARAMSVVQAALRAKGIGVARRVAEGLAPWVGDRVGSA